MHIPRSYQKGNNYGVQKLNDKELYNLYYSHNIVKVIKLGTIIGTRNAGY
jgi:hypothetical protein